MNKLFATVGLAATVTFAGCAHSPKEITTAYVSPLTYRTYDCDQLAMESDYINRKAQQLYTSLDKKATNDAIAMGVGMVLFWPALFALSGGDGPEATQYAELKVKMEAIQATSIQNKCSLQVAMFTPPEKPARTSDNTGFQAN